MPKSKLIRFTTLFLFLTFLIESLICGVFVLFLIFDFLFAVLVLRTLEPNPDVIGADDNRSRALFMAAFHLRLVFFVSG